MTLADFLAFALTPLGAALIVNALLANVTSLVDLAPVWRRIIGLVLCLILPFLALVLEMWLKLIPLLGPEQVFQAFATAVLAANLLQLVALPKELPAGPARVVQRERARKAW